MSVGHSSDSHCIGFSEPPGVFLDYNNSMLGEGTKKALFVIFYYEGGGGAAEMLKHYEAFL